MKFNIKSIINSERGKYVISILLGLGLASFFRKACQERNCLVFKAPPMHEIKNKIFGFNDKCYKYNINHAQCNDKKTIVTMGEN
tara:strand:- start:768 stop:1019 length:252 start_codon:yes stop_codon:yes gene_type:complete